MRFVCDSCRAQYTISDDKVGAKGVKVRCKRCGYTITVRPVDYKASVSNDAPHDPFGLFSSSPGSLSHLASSLASANNGQGSPAQSRNQIFISYSHKDRKWREKLEIHLKPLFDKQHITIWSDAKIELGAKWRTEIDTALARTKVALLLVSPYFLASDFIMSEELPVLLKAAAAGEIKILCILVSACSYEDTVISHYQFAPDPKRPLNRMHHAHVDDALVKICREVRSAVTDLPLPTRSPLSWRRGASASSSATCS